MITCGQIIEKYLAYLGTRPSAAKYGQIYRQSWRGTELGNRPANEVTSYDLMLYKQQHEATPAQCRKALQMVSQAYHWAMYTIDMETKKPFYIGLNPAVGVKKPITRSRERLMHQSEIRLLLDSIDFLSLKYQAFFMTRLLTPCRIKELCEMKRADVDLATGKWFKKITKNGRPQYTLIPRQAVEHLKLLQREGDYFFCGIYGRPLQRESARKVWATLRKQLGMPDVQLLDFRRTLASYLYVEMKADDLTAKAVLNHFDSRPVAVYVRLSYDRLSEIIQQYADWICNLKRTPSSPIQRIQQCPASDLGSADLREECVTPS
jgi:integrase